MIIFLSFVPPLIVLGMVLTSVAGLLWAPFAAMITSHQARKHGLTGYHYIVAGALYSVFLLAPWFHLNSEIRGDKAGTSIGWKLVLLYTFWMAGPIAMLWQGRDSFGPGPGIITVVFWVMLAAWAGSMIPLGKAGRFHVGPLLHVGYILPFALAWANAVIVFVMGSSILENPQ